MIFSFALISVFVDIVETFLIPFQIYFVIHCIYLRVLYLTRIHLPMLWLIYVEVPYLKDRIFYLDPSYEARMLEALSSSCFFFNNISFSLRYAWAKPENESLLIVERILITFARMNLKYNLFFYGLRKVCQTNKSYSEEYIVRYKK